VQLKVCTWSIQQIVQVGQYLHCFEEYINNLYIKSKFILLSFNMRNLVYVALRHLTILTSLIRHVNACALNHGTKKEQVRFYIFTRMQLGDTPVKIHQDLEYVYGESACS
jgi:hypothetical protein